MPNKLVEPVMITSPDGEGVILSGGALWINGNLKLLNTFIELRMNMETKELAWSTLAQKMAVKREHHVMFAIPESYCGDENNTNNHGEMAFPTWATAGSILTLGIGITVTYVCLKRRLLFCWRKNTDNTLNYAMKNNISEEISNHEDLLSEPPHLGLGCSSSQHFPGINQEINPSYQEYNSLPLLNTEKIITGKVIGNGSFGDVYEGTLYCTTSATTCQKVAIKVLKNASNYEEFYKEALAANGLQHENIVEFLGISNGGPTKMILFEFMDGGQLLDYLKSKGEQQSISDLIEILFDVCKGCAYMELMKFVHRDLAARNCLLTFSDKLKRKVWYKQN